jgi:ATP-dependent RNA helicase DDX23/PRP28
LKEEYDTFGKRFGLKSEALVGGRSLGKQEMTLNQTGVETVFGTVGRTKDAIENSMLVLNQCYYVIIDEADSMFSMDLIGKICLIFRAFEVHFEVNSRRK